LAEILLRQYAIKWWFAIPGNCFFQSHCKPCLENDTALACYILDTHQVINAVDRRLVTSKSSVFFQDIQHDWRDNFWGSCFPR